MPRKDRPIRAERERVPALLPGLSDPAPFKFNFSGLSEALGIEPEAAELEDPADLDDGVQLISKDVEVDDDDDSDEPKGFVEEANEEIGTALKRIKAQADHARKRFLATTDTDYYINIVFLSQEQKQAFMRATGWEEFSGGSRYVNGLALARQLKIELPAAEYAPFEPKLVKGELQWPTQTEPVGVARRGGKPRAKRSAPRPSSAKRRR